ncbi:Glycine dehydrogenase (decarboxylating) [bacterium HR39]|nr:Glycine dehydrogenase (decarboxylating) [bacterium HR39]
MSRLPPCSPDPFIWRHIGPRPAEIEAMCRELGAADLDEVIDRALPPQIRTARPLDLPPPLDEHEAKRRLASYAARNRPGRALIGMGFYGTRMPAVIRRNILENPGWYTAYTPYQSEVSQGRLEALMVFQTMVADLTGMEVSNASLLDEASAAAEAMTMARRLSKLSARTFFVDRDTHPQTKAVVRTRARFLGIEVVEDEAERAGEHDVFAALLSYPASSGAIRDPRPVIGALHARGALAVVATDLLALTLLMPPGEMGADIVVGSTQRFGLPMGWGGPHAAFLAARMAHVRQMPGRIIGLSVDARGRPAYRMALQAREQHIRREKSTSNICTAQVLPAILATMYAVWHGPEGLREIAQRIHRLTCDLAQGLRRLGFEPLHGHFFDTLTVRTPGRAAEIHRRARERDIELREIDADHVGLSLDELANEALVATLLEVFAGEPVEGPEPSDDPAIPEGLARTGGYLRHPVFHEHRSETEMMRWLRRLQEKDMALDRSMIPLGSCTMKLNAAAELEPILMPGFADIHPFVPKERAEGYRLLLRDLEAWLCEITGFDAVSFQPNAGSQGEYTGLLVIRAYHESRGEGHRDVCLIPASAHGTNPASAVMAGLRVVTVACDREGNVDLADLEARAREHADRLAALMVTYPSTHGVFEETIREICEIVHAHGGQVYMDGANLNAMLGLARPAELGADVCHLNLHKTFAIPHGGGGPGMAPIGVKKHLAPFLPGHPVVPGVNPHAKDGSEVGTVAAAPYGSPMILPISWAFIAMMGAEGLTLASKVAILNANYVAHRLDPHFPVVYRGKRGMVAHECIVDLRHLRRATGLTAEDAAKRLADFGFHAPTLSWPVPETMMIEPTESEPKAELDRFCEAMIAIRGEFAAVERGEMKAEESPLRHAPHPADLLAEDEWKRPYARRQAVFPLPWVAEAKYWPPVARVDNVYGDRHLVPVLPLPGESREEGGRAA